jgi:HlyD family secretion protein
VNKRLLLILGVIVAIVAVAIVQARRGGGSTVEVQVEKLAPRSIESSVLASGRLVHEDEVKLSTEEIGKVTEIYVAEGDHVTRGQLVLQIDDQRHRAAVEQNEAMVRMQEIAIQRMQLQVENLKTQWERTRQVYERNLVDEDTYVRATNALEVAEVDLASSRESLSQARAQLEQAQDRLSKTRAYSPIDGTVTSLDIKVGETAISSSTNIPGSSLMTIANPASIHTEVNVDEADIASIEVGQRARVFAIAYPDDPVDGVVDSIAVSAKVAEGQQGLSFAVKIRFSGTGDVTLRPGMSCRAEIFTATKEAVLATPIQAILVEEDLELDETKRYAFVNRNGVAERVEVEVGLSDDTYQEITAGLKGGDEVIRGPDRVLRALEDGDRVRAVEADEDESDENSADDDSRAADSAAEHESD